MIDEFDPTERQVRPLQEHRFSSPRRLAAQRVIFLGGKWGEKGERPNEGHGTGSHTAKTSRRRGVVELAGHRGFGIVASMCIIVRIRPLARAIYDRYRSPSHEFPFPRFSPLLSYSSSYLCQC